MFDIDKSKSIYYTVLALALTFRLIFAIELNGTVLSQVLMEVCQGCMSRNFDLDRMCIYFEPNININYSVLLTI